MAGGGGLTMGYTVELWAVPPGRVLERLHAADPSPPAASIPDDTRNLWAELAPVVAGAIAQGGRPLVAEEAHYVAGVVRAVGHHYGSLDHTSSGGEEFRTRFLPGPASARYGRERVAHLVSRDLAGLTWVEYPELGHLRAPEVAAAAEQVAAGPPVGGDHPEDLGKLGILDAAFARAARHGLELHAIYV